MGRPVAWQPPGTAAIQNRCIQEYRRGTSLPLASLAGLPAIAGGFGPSAYTLNHASTINRLGGRRASVKRCSILMIGRSMRL